MTTGTPRGVIITHDNLMANERAIQAAFRHTNDSVCVNWLPVFRWLAVCPVIQGFQ